MSSLARKESMTAQVLAVLDAAATPLALREVADAAGLPLDSTSNCLSYLLNLEKAKRVGSRNRYRYAPLSMAVTENLPTIAQLPLAGRALGPCVGVVVLLDQQRNAA